MFTTWRIEFLLTFTRFKKPFIASQIPLILTKYSTTSSMTNVVELKVGLHCEECIKKILKTIKKFEDIEAYDVDTKLNKVIVTGNVTNEEVIRALQKIGKQATNWEQV
ncbi:hypothetical protein L1887_23461 [Cichorium endivia]|nr:hypothetical protein L1887_23461 [Cichorium endivia]